MDKKERLEADAKANEEWMRNALKAKKEGKKTSKSIRFGRVDNKKVQAKMDEALKKIVMGGHLNRVIELKKGKNGAYQKEEEEERSKS